MAPRVSNYATKSKLVSATLHNNQDNELPFDEAHIESRQPHSSFQQGSDYHGHASYSKPICPSFLSVLSAFLFYLGTVKKDDKTKEGRERMLRELFVIRLLRPSARNPPTELELGPDLRAFHQSLGRGDIGK